MSGSAKISSIDKLSEFRAKYITARDRIKSALAEADADIQRLKMWLTQEQKGYWENQLRKRQEAYQVAKRELTNRKVQKSMLGNRQDTTDQEKAFKKATIALEESQEKLKNIQRWTAVLDKEIYSYKGAVQPITSFAQEDMVHGAALLEAMVISLQKYADYNMGELDSMARNGQVEIEQQESDNSSELDSQTGQPEQEGQEDER